MGPRYRGIDHPWRNFSQCQLPVRKGRGETDGLHSSWRTPSEWIPLLQRCPDPLRSWLKTAQATEILTKMSHKKEVEKSVRCVTRHFSISQNKKRYGKQCQRAPVWESHALLPHFQPWGEFERGNWNCSQAEKSLQEVSCWSSYQGNQQMLSCLERGWAYGGQDVFWPINPNKRPLLWTVSNNNTSISFNPPLE